MSLFNCQETHRATICHVVLTDNNTSPIMLLLSSLGRVKVASRNNPSSTAERVTLLKTQQTYVQKTNKLCIINISEASMSPVSRSSSQLLFVYWGGVEPSPILLRPVNGLLYQECGVIGGTLGRGNLPKCRFVHRKFHMTWTGLEAAPRGGNTATNLLSYGTAILTY
jgi:hypothetical protein